MRTVGQVRAMAIKARDFALTVPEFQEFLAQVFVLTDEYEAVCKQLSVANRQIADLSHYCCFERGLK